MLDQLRMNKDVLSAVCWVQSYQKARVIVNIVIQKELAIVIKKLKSYQDDYTHTGCLLTETMLPKRNPNFPNIVAKKPDFHMLYERRQGFPVGPLLETEDIFRYLIS